MSIEMDNPKTPLEQADAAANLVEQMMLAHSIRDEAHFKKAHKKASDLLFELIQQLEEKEDA
jgi:hypothetical protein